MAEAVVNVARRINAIVEDGTDFLGKTPWTSFYCPFSVFTFIQFVSQRMNEE